MNGQSISILPGSPDPARYGALKRGILNLTGREGGKGNIAPIQMGYDAATHKI
jgi:hypothetical protein